MGRAFRKIFNLYPGEARTASLFLILGFFWAVGAYGGLALSEGMFLQHVGADKLPCAYLFSAMAMCSLSALLLFALHRLPIPYLLASVILGAIVCYSLLFFLLSFYGNALWPWFLFKILGCVTPIAIYITYWAFIDQYYDLQDAKRWFCLLNAILFLGDACAGGVISQALCLLHVNGMLLFFIAMMASSLPIVFLIVKKSKKTLIALGASHHVPEVKRSIKQIFNLVIRSPFTLILMLFYFLMQLIVLATEYNYMDAFQKEFANAQNEHALTEFIGKISLWVSLGNLVFSLFCYSRTVARIGINNIILIAPFFFFSIFSVWSWSGVFACAVFAVIGREGMIYTFDDNNLLLLISGVPTRIKNQMRIIIESFFEPVGMLCGAMLLFFFQHYSKYLGLILAAGASLVVLFLRAQYPKAILHNLMDYSIRFEKKTRDWMSSFSKKEQKKIESRLLTFFKKEDEGARLLALEYLLKTQNERYLPRILSQFGVLSLRGKLKMITLIEASVFAKQPVVIERMEQWKKLLPHANVKDAIHFYFAKHGIHPQRKVAVSNPATLLSSSDEMHICMGLNLLASEEKPDHIDLLLPHSKHSHLAVKRACARAIASCSDHSHHHLCSSYVEHIVKEKDPETRLSYLHALEKIAHPTTVKELLSSGIDFKRNEYAVIENMILSQGKIHISHLKSLIEDETMPIRARLAAGKMLRKLSPLQLQSLIVSLIPKEIQRAHFYLSHAESLEKEASDNHDFKILESTLFTTYRSVLDFIIQLTMAAGAYEEPEILSHTLFSKNRKIRAHAIEMLEKVAKPHLFALIKPLIEEKERRIKDKREPDLNEILHILESSPQSAHRLIALTLKKRFQNALQPLST